MNKSEKNAGDLKVYLEICTPIYEPRSCHSNAKLYKTAQGKHIQIVVVIEILMHDSNRFTKLAEEITTPETVRRIKSHMLYSRWIAGTRNWVMDFA